MAQPHPEPQGGGYNGEEEEEAMCRCSFIYQKRIFASPLPIRTPAVSVPPLCLLNRTCLESKGAQGCPTEVLARCGKRRGKPLLVVP